MSSVAEHLRRGREAARLTVHQVADTTKMRGDHVIALEEGNYDVFPAPVYIRGFVRSYAQLLKLDSAELLTQLEKELAQSKKHCEPPPLGPQTRSLLDFVMYQLSKVNWRIAAPLAAIALVFFLAVWGVRAWKMHQARDPLAKLGPGLYEPRKTSDTLPLPSPR
jgi:cytoskeletal protein RodZ